MNTIHYIAGSGSHGCLYDQCGSYKSRRAAIDGLTCILDLTTRQVRTLRKDNYVSLPSGHGADYAEITLCDCDNPDQHNDD